jgi:hypothetical protein
MFYEVIYQKYDFLELLILSVNFIVHIKAN